MRLALWLGAMTAGGCWPGPLAEIEPDQPVPPPKEWKWELVKVYPRDPSAFTQGLVWDNGVLYESLGLYGQSALRRVELETGRTLAEVRLGASYFGEGLARHEGMLYQLTWREGIVFVWDMQTLELRRQHRYTGEGWGLARLGQELVMSDGSDTLRVMNPGAFREVRRIRVRSDKGPVTGLNELEMMDGLLLANVFQTEEVVVIDPWTGAVVGRIDFTGLFPESARVPGMDVMNGLAWREDTRALLVTGKRWPLLFEVRLTAP